MRDRRKARESRDSVNGFSDDGGTIGEANVYLVVFEQGICAVRILSYFGVVFFSSLLRPVPLCGYLWSVQVYCSTMGRRLIVPFRTYGSRQESYQVFPRYHQHDFRWAISFRVSGRTAKSSI